MSPEDFIENWDSTLDWFHGSPRRLESIRAGSTITQDKNLARVFSHNPSLVVQDLEDTDERQLRHSGDEPGYLYRVSEAVGPDDVYPHPTTTMGPGQEWLTRRDLRVEVLSDTHVVEDERLTATEIADLERRAAWRRASSSDDAVEGTA